MVFVVGMSTIKAHPGPEFAAVFPCELPECSRGIYGVSHHSEFHVEVLMRHSLPTTLLLSVVYGEEGGND